MTFEFLKKDRIYWYYAQCTSATYRSMYLLNRMPGVYSTTNKRNG